MTDVRVRFAPSPTGYLHIGGARTALYNWLFSRKHGGTFVLRIEDTDVERSDRALADAILDQLKWLGLTWDEGPNYQSANLTRHKEAAEKLLANGSAYRCFCTKEELDAKREHAVKNKLDYKYDGTCRNRPPEEVERLVAEERPYVIRFKVPRDGRSIAFDDRIQGPIEKSTDDIEDFVIVRADGNPLYLLSNCVDDATDRITHVIRGQDGVANAPKQILLYEALGHPVPTFAHMSLTLDAQGRKISKRVHGLAVSVGFFRDRGFLPWALCNALVLLGWSTSDDREYFTPEELTEAFSLEGCNKVNSKFQIVPEDQITDGLRDWTDPKFLRINATYLREMDIDALAPLVRKRMEDQGIWNPAWAAEKADWFRGTVDLIRERYFTLQDFLTVGRAFFRDDYAFDEAGVRKNLLKDERVFDMLRELADAYEKLPDWNAEALETVLRGLVEKWGVKAGLPINAARVALTGQPVGPSMFETFLKIGRERTIERLRNVERKVRQAD